VYTPDWETVPTGESNVQVTVGLDAPVAVALNVCVWASLSVAPAGATETVIADSNEMTVRANLVVSAMLVTVIWTDWSKSTALGAVYTAVAPVAEIVPTAGFKDHVTPVFVVPVTVAVSAWV
jgi:hypothetical protein